MNLPRVRSFGGWGQLASYALAVCLGAALGIGLNEACQVGTPGAWLLALALLAFSALLAGYILWNNRRKNGELYHVSTTASPVRYFAAVQRDITPQVLAEQTMRESEERYRSLLGALSDGVVLQDSQGALLQMNTSAERILGLSFEDAEHKSLQSVTELPWRMVDDVGQEYVPEALPYVEALRSGKPVLNKVLGLEKPDGCKTWISVSSQPLTRPGEEAPYAVVSSLHDITERNTAGQELAAYARQERLLNDITRAAIAYTDLNGMLQTMADRLGELLGADGVYMSLWDDVAHRPIPAAAYGQMRGRYTTMDLPQPGEKYLSAAVLEKGRVIPVEDVFHTEYLSPRIAAMFPSQSLLGLPLIVHEQKLGVAMVSFETRHVFSQEEIRLGEQAAGQIALAVQKARLLESEREERIYTEALRQAGLVLGGSLEMDELLERILELVYLVVPYDSAAYLEIKQEKLVVQKTRGYERFGLDETKLAEGLPQDLGAYLTLERLVNQHEPVLISDTATEAGWMQMQSRSYVGSWIGAPVMFEGRVAGLLSLDKVEPNFYRPVHLARLAAFTAQAALALQNAQLFEQVQTMAMTDPLTGSYNRRYFFELAERDFEYARRYSRPLALIMMDVDHFKLVNDTFGHLAGDLALRQVAEVCQARLRKTDLFARYGGEEFIVLLPETTKEAASSLAETLRDQVAEIEMETRRGSLRVTVSIGVSELTDGKDEEMTVEQLIEEADRALYRAKGGGRNQVRT